MYAPFALLLSVPMVMGATHHERRALDFASFRMKPTTSYVPASNVAEKVDLTRIRRNDPVATATDLFQHISNSTNFVINSVYTGTNGVSHVYLHQTINGIDVENADLNVNVGSDGQVFSYGSSLFTGQVEASVSRFVGPVVALRSVSKLLNLPIVSESATAALATGDDAATESYLIQGTTGTIQTPKAKLVYLHNGGKIELAWRVETDLGGNWLESYVDAATASRIIGVADNVADATFQVYPWGVNDPDAGSRVIETNPWLLSASPSTWLSGTTTQGNNIFAVQVSGTSNHPVSPTLKFEYPYSPATADPTQYQSASAVQAFYTANKYHDFLYVLGFNEQAGNFQLTNTAGGKGNDRITITSQSAAAPNNAFFSGSGADGSSANINFGIWTYNTPKQDSTFDAGIVIHEYTHGVSNRLTGGPSRSGCLSLTESGGMGEGWGDFMGTAIRTKNTDTRATDYGVGTWDFNTGSLGIRPHKYSTSLTTNPELYSTNNLQAYLANVHYSGAIWANMLYEVMWNLIDKNGNTANKFPTLNASGVPTDGRHLAMKLVLDGMALQPCNPTFINARDAIIDADTALTGGNNFCEIWKGFAKRGLGTAAVNNGGTRVDSFTLPSRC